MDFSERIWIQQSSTYNLHWRTQDLKKGGVVVEGDHQKGEGAGGDVPPPARSAEAFENVNSVC